MRALWHRYEKEAYLGIALASLGLLAEAEREFEAAVRLTPDLADAQRNLEQALQRPPTGLPRRRIEWVVAHAFTGSRRKTGQRPARASNSSGLGPVTRPAFFMKPTPVIPFGSPRSFGSAGAGGAFGFADPARQVGYAYVTNRMGTRLTGDPRDVALRDALYDAIRVSSCLPLQRIA